MGPRLGAGTTLAGRREGLIGAELGAVPEALALPAGGITGLLAKSPSYRNGGRGREAAALREIAPGTPRLTQYRLWG